jgi:hypothetical protein
MKEPAVGSFPALSNHNTKSKYISAWLALWTTVKSCELKCKVKCIASFTSSSMAAQLNILQPPITQSLKCGHLILAQQLLSRVASPSTNTFVNLRTPPCNKTSGVDHGSKLYLPNGTKGQRPEIK